MLELNAEQWLPVAREELFPFFADAGNLQELTPPWMQFEIVTPRPIAMHAGALIDYKLRVRGVPLRWRSKITVWEPPMRFVDEQVRGPFRRWIHEHRFESQNGGTLVSDRVRYAVLGGALIDWLIVRKDVARIFAYRAQTLRALYLGLAPARIATLNPRDILPGEYVLYWMQQSQRASFNHALEYAVDLANEIGKPLVVGFGLMDDYPEANLRHYVFLLEGLRETEIALRHRGIAFVLRHGQPPAVALELAERACAVVCDRGYLRHQRAWRSSVAARAKCRVVQVEADVIVPVEAASPKAEIAARTLRPRIQRQLAAYLEELIPVALKHHADHLRLPASMDLAVPETLARTMKLDLSVQPVTRFFHGGTSAAENLFRTFLAERFSTYTAHRNQPQTNDVSHMSKYLHFGQISPSWLALEARKVSAQAGENVATFIEELLVRRELSMNFTHYRDDYDRYETLPAWARQSLAAHRDDPRPYLYNRDRLEAAETHDPYWNAAMREMRETGYMHNYMRMYWGKKIIEWTATPEEAHATALAINNRYFLDGRDANSFANIAWLFGQHDRPWPERPVFGKVRYMNARGLERKSDIQAYVRKVDRLTRDERS